MKRQEIWIEWAGAVYGPYTSAADALRDGFHLPPPEEKEDAHSS